jgi:hypothetical protein
MEEVPRAGYRSEKILSETPFVYPRLHEREEPSREKSRRKSVFALTSSHRNLAGGQG